ncbi:MAG: hypothetical protein KIT31_37480 [Deltaproteobacteria bacterium]|nr:hypothetical protein [Deltaproteobacteria bacterium]
MQRLAIASAAISFALFAACGGMSSSTGTTPGDPPPPAAKPCVKAGCSSTVCTDAAAEDVITTCEFKPEYACYQHATCERQPDHTCGWTKTPELEACLANPPPAG